MECTISVIYNQLSNAARAYINPKHIHDLDIEYNSVILIDKVPLQVWPSMKIKLYEIGIGSTISKMLNKGIADVCTLKILPTVPDASHVYFKENLDPQVIKCLKDVLMTKRYVSEGILPFKAFGKWSECTIVAIYPNSNTILKMTKDTILMERTTQDTSVAFGGYTQLVDDMLEQAQTSFQSKSKNKNIILFGLPGTGKSTLCKYISQRLNCPLYVIDCLSILSSYLGETQVKLKSIFQQAILSKPCIVLLKDMHVLCKNREIDSTNIHHKITNSLLSILDGELDLSFIFIIGTTTDIDAIDPAFKRNGRFEREIEVSVPELIDREAIFATWPHEINCSELELREFIQQLHGYVGADIIALLKYAHFKSLSTGKLDLEALYFGKSFIRPSALKDVLLTVPNVKWSDIGGQEETKEAIRTAIELPFLKPDLFKFHNITPPSGLLLYGPPGTGKTLMAKAVATESNFNFLSVKGPELFNKYVGESEKALQQIFVKARSVAPVVIFFDEIDAIGKKRSDASHVGDRMLIQLLVELDGIQHINHITVIAATNRPDVLDEALIRPGRFDQFIYVAPPDLQARVDIFTINCAKLPVTTIDYSKLAQLSEGCTGAEIKAICQEAAYYAIEHDLNSISQELLVQCCKDNKTRLDSKTMDYYTSFKARHS